MAQSVNQNKCQFVTVGLLVVPHMIQNRVGIRSVTEYASDFSRQPNRSEMPDEALGIRSAAMSKVLRQPEGEHHSNGDGLSVKKLFGVAHSGL
jgi:hypothetical protein